MPSVALASQPANWEREALVLRHYSKTGLLLPVQFMAKPIGPFYERFGHRLFTYLLILTCLIGGTFLALGFAGTTSFLLQHLPLACTLALYLAIVFTFSHVLSDLAAHYLWPSRMAYGSRNVGRQYMVVFSGLALGFWVHQGVYPELMRLCAPKLAIDVPTMLYVVPLCCATFYACLLMVPMSQNETGKKGDAEPGPCAGNLLHDNPVTLKAAVPAPPPAVPATAVSLRINGRSVKILLRDISHVRMEDHYCRVYYKSNRGLQYRLVRETLKGLAGRLGTDEFMQIHRSHLVNKKHVVAYKRKGRKHWLLLGPSRVALSISQRRQKQVKEALAGTLSI